MPRVTVEDLKAIKERTLKTMCLDSCTLHAKITMHMGTCGIAAGAGPVMEALKEELAAPAALGRDIRVVVSACAGMCSSEPNVTVEVAGEKPVVYQQMDADRMRQVFRRHVLAGEVQAPFALVRQEIFSQKGAK
jgi:NADP-reducing hydrogenase subunit HndB